jgi:molybdenum cofactor cytidylyltransferase
MDRIWVTELEDGEVFEDEAVMMVASEVGCGSLEIRLAAGGRANLVATGECCILLDDELLRQINCTGSTVIATLPNFSHAGSETRVATVKSAPFAIARTELDAMVSILKERGPILQARPIKDASVAVLYSDPVTGERARQLFDAIMLQRLDRFNVKIRYSLASVEEEDAVARSLMQLVRSKPSMVTVASTTAPAGPDDVVGRALRRIGCHLERFPRRLSPGTFCCWRTKTMFRLSALQAATAQPGRTCWICCSPLCLRATECPAGRSQVWVTAASWVDIQ